jgi:hypothetical protein
MKVTIKVEKEVEIKTLAIAANVRYWEAATINGIEDEDGTLTPCKDGDLWKPVIDIDTGIIQNWEQGKKANIHFKVCDEGSYYLKDENGVTLLSIEDNYVPKIAYPERNGYGDYIIMNIDESGKIDNWNPDIEDFLENED